MSEHIDPRRVAVETHSQPGWSEPESFHDVMAEQLRRAPWLAISVMFHAFIVLILFQIPASLHRDTNLVTLETRLEEPETVVEDLPPEPPEQPEPPDPTEPTLQNVDELPVDPEPETEDIAEDSFEDSDIDLFANADVPLGIGPGDQGIRGGRKTGRENLRRTGRPIPDGILIALRWLAKHQDADGHWSSAEYMKHCPAHDLCGGPGNAVNDVGLTGLALLAFLGDGSTLRSGNYRDVVKRATIWLKDQQDDDGLLGTAAGRQFMYNHAIASLALIESYGLSKYRTLHGYAQRCVDYICKARNPYKVWRYYPRDGDNDTSVTGWMVFVLKSAQDFGLRVDTDALRYSLAWFDEVTDPVTGQCGYTKRGEGSSRELGLTEKFPSAGTEAMTATGLLCRIFLKSKEELRQGWQPVELAAAKTMLEKPPVWNESNGSIDLYYWYYATYAMFQLGGQRWKQWRKHMEPALLKPQHKTGHRKGSWDPVGAWGHAGGRVYSTAIGVLCLQVYYRYSQLVR